MKFINFVLVVSTLFFIRDKMCGLKGSYAVWGVGSMNNAVR